MEVKIRRNAGGSRMFKKLSSLKEKWKEGMLAFQVKGSLKVKSLACAVFGGIGSLLFGSVAFADKPKATKQPWDFLTEDNGKKGAFDGLTEAAQTTGRSAVNLIQTIGISVLLAGVIGVGIGIIWNARSSGQKLQENKGALLSLILGGVLILGGTTFLIFCESIANGLASSI